MIAKLFFTDAKLVRFSADPRSLAMPDMEGAVMVDFDTDDLPVLFERLKLSTDGVTLRDGLIVLNGRDEFDPSTPQRALLRKARSATPGTLTDAERDSLLQYLLKRDEARDL